MADKFDFPSDLTRRERWMFEKYAGCTMAQFGNLVSDVETQDQLTVDMEAALLLVAVRRERGQTITFDNVLDSDWELLPPPNAGDDVEGDDAGDIDSPLPPPATSSTDDTKS